MQALRVQTWMYCTRVTMDLIPHSMADITCSTFHIRGTIFTSVHVILTFKRNTATIEVVGIETRIRGLRKSQWNITIDDGIKST